MVPGEIMRRLLVALVLLLAFAVPVWAQSGTGGDVPASQSEMPKLPDPLTHDGVRDLVSTISDADARKLLVEVLDKLAVKAPASVEEAARTGFVAAVKEGASGVFYSIRDTFARTPLVIPGIARATGNFIEKHGWPLIGRTFVIMAIALMISLAAGMAFNRLAGSWRQHIRNQGMPDSLLELAKILTGRILVDLGDLIILLIVLQLIVGQFVAPEMRDFARNFLISLVVLPKVTAELTGVLLAPRNPEWRLVNVDDATAGKLWIHQVAIVAFMGLGAFLVEFQVGNGVPLGETRLGAWTTLIIFVWIGLIVWKYRDGLRQMMAGWDADITPIEKFAAHWFPTAMLVLLAFMWLLVEYLVSIGRFDLLVGGRHYLTVVLFALTPALDTAIRAVVRQLAPKIHGEGTLAEQALVASNRSYLRIGRTLVFGMALLVTARIWEISFTNIAAAGVGAQFAGHLVQALVIAATGYLVWEFSMSWINRQLSKESLPVAVHSDEMGEGEGAAAGSRLATVLPLLRLLLQATIVIMTLLLALGQIGIDITPLLAGAGILGLAIGFGAQTLVKDIVSGLFFLIDDAFRVGEYIVVGSTEGTVEKISVRSLQLRHASGLVHTLPYGEIAQVTNASRDWVIVKMKFTVPFNTDMKKVKKIFKTIGADILNEPYAADILQTFKLQGVGDVNDVGIVIRGKFTAKPGRQWMVRKDVYARIQRMFDENGIEFARREVRVNIAGPGAASLDEDGKRQIAAAAVDIVAAEAAAKPA